MKTRTLFLVFSCLCLFSPDAKAMNSLVTAEGIKQMKTADLSPELIAFIAAEQTCSVGPDLLIDLQKAGVDENTLRDIILADRCQQRRPARLSVEEIEILKKAGCSDGMIIRLIGSSAVETVVDEQGNERVLYRTDRVESTQEATNVDDPQSFNINIEKVEER